MIFQIAEHPDQESGNTAIGIKDLCGFGHCLGEGFEFVHEGFVIVGFHGVAEFGDVGFEGFEGSCFGRFGYSDGFFRFCLFVG